MNFKIRPFSHNNNSWKGQDSPEKPNTPTNQITNDSKKCVVLTIQKNMCLTGIGVYVSIYLRFNKVA